MRILWVALLWLLAPLLWAAECPRLAVDRVVQVQQVVDGDTLRLKGGESIRLVGINAPEIGRDGRPDQAGAQSARRALRDLVEQGDQVTLSLGEQGKDRYGRVLAHVAVDGRSVEQRLVAQGLAFAVAIAPNLALADCLFATEREARDSGRGLWRELQVQPVGTVRQGGFAWVEGRVSGVFETRRSWYVELDDQLAIRLGSEHLTPAQRRALKAMRGERVQVRGWVVDRGAQKNNAAQSRKRWLISLSDLRNIESMPD